MFALTEQKETHHAIFWTDNLIKGIKVHSTKWEHQQIQKCTLVVVYCRPCSLKLTLCSVLGSPQEAAPGDSPSQEVGRRSQIFPLPPSLPKPEWLTLGPASLSAEPPPLSQTPEPYTVRLSPFVPGTRASATAPFIGGCAF